MSSLTSALAAALQNDSTISPLITGVIPGRNFDLQDAMLASSPYACIGLRDLLIVDTPYFGTRTNGNKLTSGQFEVRCIAKNEAAAKDLAEAVKTFLWSTRTVSWNGSTITLGISSIRQDSDANDELTTFLEILTCDY